MPAVEANLAPPPAIADMVALVRAQLEPIGSRRALLDSYRRESLCRLATSLSAGSAAEVLEMAYALRWFELDSDSVVDDSTAGVFVELVDE
jgi:hypothetical protein